MAYDGTLEEVDNIMAELGLSNDTSKLPRNGNLSNGVKVPPLGVSEDEVDNLMAEIGVSSMNSGVVPSASKSTLPPTKKISSGPGPAFSKGKSSGPGPSAVVSANVGANVPSLSAASSSPIQPAKQTPDGREIIYQGPPCAHCGAMIVGRCTNAMGKTWHPEHFVCTHCSLPFPGGSFIEHEDQPYCEKDYAELFCPRCVNCGLPIVDKAISAGTGKYHPQHFTCSGCGKNLVGQKFKEDDGEVFCTSCKVSRKQRSAPPSEICGKCKKPILGDYIIMGGHKVHSEHYRCEECGSEFKDGNCHEYEGKYYCTADYQRLIRMTCASCNKPILGRSLTALGRLWHPEHFVCCVCKEPFSGTNFFENEGKPYCELHFTQEFGVPCFKCNRPVVHNAVHFLDKVYHEEHFVCTACEGRLKKGKITEWEGKPMCFDCFDKLPKEVRKRVKKKRDAEKKIEKKRADEKKAAEKTK